VKSAIAFMNKKFEVARTGQSWEELQRNIQSSRKEPWFQMVNAPSSLEGLREAWNGQFSYDPNSDLVSLKIPVLGIFGELDTETPAQRIAMKTQEVLSRAGSRCDYFKVFPRATHGIMVFPQEGQPWFFFKFVDGYMPLMSEWVLKIAKGKCV